MLGVLVAVGSLRRRHLRYWRRLDSCPDPGWLWPFASGGCAGDPGLDVCDVHRGVVTFVILQWSEEGAVGPDWGVGIALGVGGLLAATPGPSLQPRFPELASDDCSASSCWRSAYGTPGLLWDSDRIGRRSSLRGSAFAFRGGGTEMINANSTTAGFDHVGDSFSNGASNWNSRASLMCRMGPLVVVLGADFGASVFVAWLVAQRGTGVGALFSSARTPHAPFVGSQQTRKLVHD